MNHIDSFISFRFVSIGENWFYQIRTDSQKESLYFSILSGKALTAGNWLYAQHIACIFLEGENNTKHNSNIPVIANTHDCCDAASDLVLNQPKGPRIQN